VKELNIGLVGYKFMGKAHSHAYKDVSMFFDVPLRPVMKVICGRDEANVKDAAQKFGWQEYETSWENLVMRNDIDLIDITAPSNVHKDIAIAAAQAGKHILCEKPLALSLSDAREMLNAVEKAGVKHMIGFNYRRAPAVQLIKELIDNGKLGKIYHFRGLYLQDWIIDPNFPLVWRLQKEVAGSGSIGDLGAHLIDIARYLVDEIDDIIGMGETFVKERPIVSEMAGLSGKAAVNAAKAPVNVDDATVALGHFKNGALFVIEATRFAAGYRNGMCFEINGSKGSVRFNLERMNELQYYSSDDEECVQGFRTIQVTEPIHPYMQAWWPAGHIIGYEHTFIHEIYDLVNSIAVNENPEPSFYDGVKCQQVLEAIEESTKQKRWVKIDSI